MDPCEPEYRKRIREKTEQDKRRLKEEEQKSIEYSNIRQIIYSAEQIVKNLERHYDENQPKNKSDRRRNLFEILGLWAAAAVGALAIVTGSLDSYEQREVMNGQLNEALAEQRPWIPIPDLKIVGPLIFQPNGDATINFGRTIYNTGHSPAINVTEKFKIDALTKKSVFNSVDEEKDLCGLTRNYAEQDIFRGKMIFPGDRDEGNAEATVGHQSFDNSWPGPNDIVFRIIGCIDYSFGADSKRHGQTGFSYMLTRPTDTSGHQAGFNPKNGPFPIDQMSLDRDFFHAGYIQ
jgi:hypothetical protein